MKTIDYEFNKRTFHLCMNANALFDTYDKFGNKGSIVDLIKGTGKKSFEATCWMLSKFAEQGELVRRYNGFKPERMDFSADYFKINMQTLDVPSAKRTLEETIRAGFLREEESEQEKEVDLGLQELEKKTETA